MPVRIFFPRIPTDQDDFLKFVGGWCSTYNAKIAKNKDGTPFCILPVNYVDTKGKSANDIIEALTGKVVGDVTLKPRLYVDHGFRINESKPLQDEVDDVVNVTHYSKDFYYVQLLSEGDKNKVIGEYLKALYEECRSNMLTLLEYDELTIGGIYASMYRNENHLFRIKVIDKLEGDEIKVLFVDYGNIEYIEDKPVLEISDKIAAISPLSHKCSIDNVCIVDAKKHDLLAKEVLNRNYKAKIIKKVNDDGIECMSVDFLDFTTVSYRNFLIFENVATDNDSESNNHDSKQGISVKGHENGVKESVDSVAVTHMDSLREFYVQSANKAVESDLLNISKKVEYLISKLRDSLQFIGNDLVYLSKFSVDGNWYRCRVIDNKWDDDKEPHCIVQFIDFGNKERKCDIKELKPLNLDWNDTAAELANIGPCATKCSFSSALVDAMTKAKIGRSFFRKEFILPEKVIKIVYIDANDSDKVSRVVDNVMVDGEEDFVTRFCVAGNGLDKEGTVVSSDYYRLSNIESVTKMWFQLVLTKDADKDRQLATIRRWSVGRIPSDVKTVANVVLGQLYCALNKHSQLFRCRVTAKNVDQALVQFIDTGIYGMVKICQLYPLTDTVASIGPIAQPYRLSMAFKVDREKDIERAIFDILEQSDVQFDNLTESGEISDIRWSGQSLGDRLLQLDLVETPRIRDCTDKYRGLLDCLLRPTTEESGDVDFSLPSADRMDEVPLEVAIENSRVQLLRNVLNIGSGDHNDGCVFDEVWRIVADCRDLDNVVACCDEVDGIEAEVTGLRTQFSDVVADRRSKMRDLVPLIERRTALCQRICATNDQLGSLLVTLSQEMIQTLSATVDRSLIAVGNLMTILGVDSGPGADETIETVRDAVLSFQRSAVSLDLVAQCDERMRCSVQAQEVLYAQLSTMCRPYRADDPLRDRANTTVSLIDSTYGLHSALKAETRHFFDVLARDDIRAQFNVGSVLRACDRYLRTQMAALATIVTKTARFASLNDYAVDIIRDDAVLTQTIEDSHRKILSSRSALRHAVPDLEDAEELDLKDRQQELHAKIRDLRQSLQTELRASRDLIDADIRRLMMKKPELQLKNQSILFREEGPPIFLWDSIYFEMSQESSTDSYVSSSFEDTKIKIRKVPLGLDNYRSVLGNFTVYSSRTSSPDSTALVSKIPVLYPFVTKCGNIVLYLVTPDFTALDRLPEALTQSLSDIVRFFRDVIDQIVNLWHLGFIYSEDDLKAAFLVQLSTGPVCLPLPVTSIVERDTLSRDSVANSINVYLRKLGTLFGQTLAGSVFDVDEALLYLVCVVTNCGDVAEAETVSEDLGAFLTKKAQVPIAEESEEDNYASPPQSPVMSPSAVSGHGSSIEQVIPGDGSGTESGDGPPLVTDVTRDQDSRQSSDSTDSSDEVAANPSVEIVTEQLLDGYADVE